MLTGRHVDGPEGIISPPDGFGLAVNDGLPAGIVGVGQDQVAGLVSFDGDGDGVEVVLEDRERAGWRRIGGWEGWKIGRGLVCLQNNRRDRVKDIGADGLPGGVVVGDNEGLADK